jgi:hypothetical protein
VPKRVNLKLTAADFRQHPAMECCEPHWLLGSAYGRHLLKTKLCQIRPDLLVSTVRAQPEHEGLLESMVDVLDLREWPKPVTIGQKLCAVRLLLRMAFDAGQRRVTPSCRRAA